MGTYFFKILSGGGYQWRGGMDLDSYATGTRPTSIGNEFGSFQNQTQRELTLNKLKTRKLTIFATFCIH